ncbi:PREDICTED: uncharacterized protein LOC105617866 [Atta cephalotes]|uniref:Uncharacterized protein n=1 Tax=Atta cephalotes TaxID=12957 RepID=A0A158NB91_ATTCE|nr:PREDICTED: uncharacterized protein LOC105617866 [Atta cephalotes]
MERSMLEINLRDKVRKDIIRSKTDVSDVVGQVATLKWRSAGQMSWAGRSRAATTTLEGMRVKLDAGRTGKGDMERNGKCLWPRNGLRKAEKQKKKRGNVLR